MIGAITAGLYGTGVPPVTNSYESIATVTVGSGGSSTISFSSIPSTFKHLQLRFLWQTASNDRNMAIQFNSDTGSNYTYHWLNGNGSTTGTAAGASQTAIQTAYNYTASGFNASYFLGGVTDVLDYTSSAKNKTVRTLCGVDYNGGGRVALDSGMWMNSSTAINSISITVNGGGNFAQYSQFALYGIKG